MIKAVIIEDEPRSREMLEAMVKKNCPQLTIVGSASNVQTGVSLIKEQKPDLLFLDIAMPDGTGFDLLEKAGGTGYEIIFTTATDKYAVKAIKYSALDYLLKPIDVEELVAAVNRTIEKKAKTSTLENIGHLLQNIRKADDQYTKITLPTGNAYEIVNVKDIVRCEAEGNYTTFFLNENRKLLVSIGLKHYEDLLPESDFIRVHHHHLINMNHVVRFLKEDGGYAIMSDNSKVEVSRRKKDAFLQRLGSI